MGEEERIRKADMERIEDFRFRIDFGGGMPELLADEPEPLGSGSGPNAGQLLAAAVGNCLSASLTLCLQKSRVDVRSMSTSATLRLARNEANRLRIHDGEVTIRLDAAGDAPKIERCLGMFEDYCIVTATIRKAFPVVVRIVDAAGAELFRSGGPEEAAS